MIRFATHPGPLRRLATTGCQKCGLALAAVLLIGLPGSFAAEPEVRALWVVRDSLLTAEAVDRMVEDAASNGFNTLLVQIRGRGDAFYLSTLEPRSHQLEPAPREFDPLLRVISRAREKGLSVHAWVNTYLISSLGELPAALDHLVNLHPDWLSVPRALAARLYPMDPHSDSYRKAIFDYCRARPAAVEGLYLEPAHPDVQEHIQAIWMDLLDNYPLQGIHFDYLRYPGPEFGYSRAALDRFQREVEAGLGGSEKADLQRRLVHDPLVYTRVFPDRWDAFRRRSVTELVEQTYRAVKAREPGVWVTAAVTGNADLAFGKRLQDWRFWLQSGILDGICPMAYSVDEQVFQREIAAARQEAAGRLLWAGIGAWRLSARQILERIQTSRRLSADGFALFSYGSLTSAGADRLSGQTLETIGKFLNPLHHREHKDH